MSEKNHLTLTIQDETSIAKLLGFKSLKGFSVEAWLTKDGRHVVNICGEEPRGPKSRFEIRLVRDGAGVEFRQGPTNFNVRVLRDLVEKRGIDKLEIDLEDYAHLRQHNGIPIALDAWQEGLRRAVAQLRDIYKQRALPLRTNIAGLQEKAVHIQRELDVYVKREEDCKAFLAAKDAGPIAAE